MQINTNNNYSVRAYQPIAPSFGSSKKQVLEGSKLVYATVTNFFRDCFNWVEGMEFLVAKYKNAAKVNVINYAASDGSEAYSFVLRLKKAHGKDADKFFPIKCYDIDDDLVARAKAGLITITEQDKKELIKQLGSEEEFNKCFVRNQYSDTYKVQDELRSCVIFEKGDMIDESKNLPPANTIVLARNVWPYLSEMGRYKLSANLGNLDKTSTVITGQFDELGKGNETYLNTLYPIYEKTSDKLKEKGFELRDRALGYVFEKIA